MAQEKYGRGSGREGLAERVGEAVGEKVDEIGQRFRTFYQRARQRIHDLRARAERRWTQRFELSRYGEGHESAERTVGERKGLVGVLGPESRAGTSYYERARMRSRARGEGELRPTRRARALGERRPAYGEQGRYGRAGERGAQERRERDEARPGQNGHS